MRILHLAGALALTIAAAGAAQAQDPPATTDPAATPPATATTTAAAGGAGFGQVGQIAITGDFELGFLHTSSSASGSSSTNDFSLSPLVHYFLAPNAHVSAGLTIATQSINVGVGNADQTNIGLLVGGGYNISLTPILSLWLNGLIGYVHTSVSFGGMDSSGYIIPLRVFAPILYHPTEHFFVGLGPSLDTMLANKMESMSQAKLTSIGVSSVVGGYFNM